MKKLLIIALVLLLAACGQTDQNEIKEVDVDQENTTEEVAAEPEQTTENKIDTSMFTAENIEITDAIDINQHVTLMIDVNEELTPGWAFRNIINETYDFIQQDSINDVKTVTIAVRQNGTKIVQFTVDKEKFAPNDQEPMAQLVLDASVVDMISPEVEEFATVMELKLNKQ